MSQGLTRAQLDELKALLLKRSDELQLEMQQNRENLAPPTTDEGGMVQRNVAREVQQSLTDMDAADLARVDRALRDMADGSYGACGECGCAIPFERLKIEPQTEHCVTCKGRWEQASGQGKAQR
ncbi:MAG: TraR/DksA C4-type zinc finger protein [Rubrivivax sp.]